MYGMALYPSDETYRSATGGLDGWFSAKAIKEASWQAITWRFSRLKHEPPHGTDVSAKMIRQQAHPSTSDAVAFYRRTGIDADEIDIAPARSQQAGDRTLSCSGSRSCRINEADLLRLARTARAGVFTELAVKGSASSDRTPWNEAGRNVMFHRS